MSCTCPDDPKTLRSTQRVYLYEPQAVRRGGNMTVTDQSKVHIYDKDCPLHGYTVFAPEEGTSVAGTK